MSKIDKNMQFEEKLKESEMRYRRLFESAKDGILILNFDTGDIVDANPFIINIIDHPLQEILGKKLWEIGLFSNKEESELAFIELQDKGYIRFEDMPIQKQNGKTTEVEFISNVYLEGNKKVIQCNIRNITERKQAERKQELIFRVLLILNNLKDWKASMNNILLEIKNYTKIENIQISLKKANEFPGNDVQDFPEYLDYSDIHMHKEIGKSNLGCVRFSVISGKTSTSFPYYTKGGSFYTNNIADLIETKYDKVLLNASSNINSLKYKSVAFIPLYSESEIVGLLILNDSRPDIFTHEMVGFFEEIANTIGIALNRIKIENKVKESRHELKKQNKEYHRLNKAYLVQNSELTESINRVENINSELIIAKEKAEESDRLKSAFLANMNHEILTPMNGIMGFSELLSEPGLSKEKIKEFIQIIRSSSLQLMSVISDIIDISKIESGKINVHIERVDINKLVKELSVLYKTNAELKKIGLKPYCEYPNEKIMVSTDGNRIKQVFCNLLNNALKFSNHGDVEFGYKVKENMIEFFVKDNGIGLAIEDQERIFERFRQVETAKIHKFGGNGLGLTISKALVEKLGGTISVNSELGLGSTFVFRIPNAKKNGNVSKSISKVKALLLNKPKKKASLIV